MKTLRPWGALISLCACALLTSCLVPDSGTESGTRIDIDPPYQVPNPEAVVCNPLNGGTPVNSRYQGVRGMLYYLDSTQPHYGTVDEYLAHGHLVSDVTLYFNQIFIPTRPFDRGFVTEAGETIINAEGNTLYEYFAVRHEGRITLGSLPAGDYQFATLADDGARFAMDFGSGLQSVVDNDGTHPTRMACSSSVVHIEEGDKIPFLLDYYQGPRYHIAMTLLWRPAPTDPALFNDIECGKQGNSYFFDSTQNPPAPTAKYNGMLARGWAPLAPENYLLPDEDVANPCNEPAPVISNYHVVTIGTNSITVAWDTDVPASHFVAYHRSGQTVDQFTTPVTDLSMHHQVTVTGLTPNSDYLLKGVSASASGLSSETAYITVRTRR